MSRRIWGLGLAVCLTSALVAEAQPDPWAGSWRGALTTPRGESTDITLTVVAGPDGGDYTGVITGFAQTTEVRLSRVRVVDGQLAVEATTQTDFGPLAFAYQLSRDGQSLSGGGHLTLGAHEFDVALELTRARRAEVVQPQVEPRIGYFAGEWRFEYTGGEFPPLSIGTRSGTVRFTDLGHAPFVRGQVRGEVFGEPYEEDWTIGFDEKTHTVVWQEQLSTGRQLLSLGDWTSPIAITFLTAPIQADGRLYVLRRMMRMTSDTAFSVTDEFSVDGGAFQRLGNGSYIRAG